MNVGIAKTIAGVPWRRGCSQAPADALFDGPTGLAVTAQGDKLLVADSGNNRVCQIDLQDAAYPVTNLVGRSGPDGLVIKCRIAEPRCIRVHKSGLLIDDHLLDPGSGLQATRRIASLRVPAGVLMALEG